MLVQSLAGEQEAHKLPLNKWSNNNFTAIFLGLLGRFPSDHNTHTTRGWDDGPVPTLTSAVFIIWKETK